MIPAPLTAEEKTHQILERRTCAQVAAWLRERESQNCTVMVLSPRFPGRELLIGEAFGHLVQLRRCQYRMAMNITLEATTLPNGGVLLENGSYIPPHQVQGTPPY